MSTVIVRQRKQVDSRWSLSESERNFGSLRSNRGLLPLEELRLQGAIRGLDFSLKLTQVFVNVHPESIEAVYIFPLPARAAVSAFTMTTQDRVIQGELQERGQARANYQQAIQAGQQAALVEEERPEVFTMTVGNIPAHQSVTVELVIEGPLTCIDDTALFRFPLVVAPKYIPGQGLAGGDVGQGTHYDTDRVPDASRISPPVLLPGYPNPVRLSIEMELDSPLLDWQELESTLPMQLETMGSKKRRRGGPMAKLIYAPQSGRIDHDFILSFPFHPQQMKTSLQVQDVDGDCFPFCLTVVPPACLSENAPEKQVVILLDRSGSMNGWKMLAAQRTVARLVDSLNSDDSFCILAFDTVVEEVRPTHLGVESRSQNWFKLNQHSQLTEASDRNRCDYANALKAVHARGGTEIAGALDEALKRFGPSQGAEVEQHIVLVTDGQVGNEREILDFLHHQAKGVRVSTIGIDQAVNAAFLEQVASSTQGLCQLVHNDEQLDRSMTKICQRIGNPALRNIQILNAPVRDLVFQHNDLYPGVATRIYGRIAGPLPEVLEVSATRPDGQAYRQQVEVLSCSGTVEKLWAREQVLQLEHQFNVGGPNTLVQQITDFSLHYGVLCRFTAFVAIDKQSRVQPQKHSVVQAVESPADWQSVQAPSPLRMRCESVRDEMPKMRQMAPPPPPSAPPMASFEQSAMRSCEKKAVMKKPSPKCEAASLHDKEISAEGPRRPIAVQLSELLKLLEAKEVIAKIKMALEDLLDSVGGWDTDLQQQIREQIEHLEVAPIPDYDKLILWVRELQEKSKSS